MLILSCVSCRVRKHWHKPLESWMEKWLIMNSWKIFCWSIYPPLLRCSPEDGQCQCLPNMIGRRCSDQAPGHFLPSLNYFLYEAELATPLSGGISSSPPPTPSSPHSPLVCMRWYWIWFISDSWSNQNI